LASLTIIIFLFRAFPILTFGSEPLGADTVLSVLPDDPAMPGLREIAKALDN
jgi:hypothetical protein